MSGTEGSAAGLAPSADADAAAGAIAGTVPAAVHLADVQRVLALFAQGIAGHYVAIGPAETLPDALRAGAPRGVDATLRLPASVARFATARENLGAYRVAVLHQLGWLEYGTWAFSMARARKRIAGLPAEAAVSPAAPAGSVTSRTAFAPGAAGARREAGTRREAGSSPPDLERFFALWPSPELMRRVFATLEDLRVDAAIRRDYPGARADLERVTVAALADRPDHSALGPVAALCDALVRFSLGADRELLLARDRTGRLAAMLEAAMPLREPAARVHDSARAAVDCYRAIVLCGLDATAQPPAGAATTDGPAAGAAVPAPPAGHDPEAPPLDDELLGAFAVDFRGELVPVRLQALAGQGLPGVLPGDELATEAGQPDGDDPDSEPTALPPRAPARRPASLPDADPGVRSFLYDEWDYHHQSYLKGWCRLYEQRLEGDDREFFREVHRRHAVLSHQVRRRFGAVRPESQRRVHGVTDGDELDLDAAIGALVDRRSGHAGDDRVYLRRDRAQREVAAAFLVDMSASTDIAVPDPDAPPCAVPSGADDDPYLHSGPWPGIEIPPVARKRRVIDVAKESLALMCDALATLGDAYAIYGFSGEGRARVEFHVAKDFGDRLSSRTWTALAAIEPRRSTRMGPAIRHASAKLRRQPARTRLLLVVSDGYPQDRDYGPDPDDEEYGIQDTARALKEAEREGVQTFCITIDPAGHDYLRRMCSEHRYLVIDEVADLPAELAKVYRALAVARRGISRVAAV